MGTVNEKGQEAILTVYKASKTAVNNMIQDLDIDFVHNGDVTTFFYTGEGYITETKTDLISRYLCYLHDVMDKLGIG